MKLGQPVRRSDTGERGMYWGVNSRGIKLFFRLRDRLVVGVPNRVRLLTNGAYALMRLNAACYMVE